MRIVAGLLAVLLVGSGCSGGSSPARSTGAGPPVTAVAPSASGTVSAEPSAHPSATPTTTSGPTSPTTPTTTPTPTTPTTPPAPDRGGLSVRASVADQGGAISVYVPVTVHGRTYAFLVDSGAAGSILDTALARRTHLRRVGPGAPLRTVGCTTPTTLSRVDSWSLGGRRLPPLVLTTKDIGFGSFRTGGLPVGGILGSDLQVMLGGVLTVDYAHRIVTFGGRVPRDGRAVAVHVAKTLAGGAVVTAPVTIGTTRLTVQVDTGAAHSTLATAVATRLGLRAAGRPQNANAVGCDVSTQPVRLRDARLGTVRLPPTVIVAVGEGSVDEGIVGLVGGDVLEQFGAVTIDYRDARLVLGG